MEQFMALTKIPILIIYGDNIPDKPVAMPAQDSWRVRLAMARKWRDVVNKHSHCHPNSRCYCQSNI